MNLMSNENITWTVERERGISFDLTALCDIESKPDAFVDIKREIKLEAESGVKDSTFGHPFGQCRPIPQPRPVSPSPFSRPLMPNKRFFPPSFDSRDAPAKRQWGASSTNTAEASTQPSAPPLGRTRSRGIRPIPSTVAATATTAAPSPNRRNTTSKRGKADGGSGRTTKAERGESAPPRAPRRKTASSGVDTMALTAELGLVDSRRRCARRNKSGVAHRVGVYTLEERAVLVAKFHSKRGRRIWRKKIKYDCRKKLADKRPRLKGRFVTQEELDGLDQETLAKVTGLGPYDPDSSGSDAEEDSDSSEGYSGSRSSMKRKRDGSRCAPISEAGKEVGATKSGQKGRKSSNGRRNSRTKDVEVASPDDQSLDSSMEVDETAVGDVDDAASSTCAVSAMFEAYADEEEGDGIASGDDETVNVGVNAGNETDGSRDFGEGGDDEDTIVKVEEYEPADLVSGFMVDEILSNNFSIVPNRDMEAMSAGVAVN